MPADIAWNQLLLSKARAKVRVREKVLLPTLQIPLQLTRTHKSRREMNSNAKWKKNALPW